MFVFLPGGAKVTLSGTPFGCLADRFFFPDRFLWASPFLDFGFFIIRFCLVPCSRLSWLLVSFWAHINILHRIVPYRTHSTTVLPHKMAIVLRPQSCDVTSPYVYYADLYSEIKQTISRQLSITDGGFIGWRKRRWGSSGPNEPSGSATGLSLLPTFSSLFSRKRHTCRLRGILSVW